MARIHIAPGVFRASREGFDAQTATFDELLFSSDWIADQALLAGVVGFGGGDSAAVLLPTMHSSYKVDFFYCVISSGSVTQIMLPDNTTATISGNVMTQLHAEFSGGYVTFTRRGNIAGQANRGVMYYIYSSALP